MFYPPSPQLPERMRAGTGFIPGELVAPDTITVCVGETIDIDLGAVDSIEGLPPGLSIISNRYLQGVFSEAFCDNITIIDQQQNRKVVRVVAIDAGVFTPRPSNITPGTTFPELEGNYSSACGIVTFSAKIRRRYIRNYRYALGSHDPLLWNGDRLYDHINNQLVRFTPPTPNNEEVTRDATASPVTISNDLRISSLGPIDNTGSQYIYFIEDNRIKRATLDGTVTTLTSSDLQYYRGAAFIPRPTSGSDTITDGQLVPHAIAANTNRIYVFCSIVGSDYGVDNSKWWEYELNWATLQDGIVQVYDLNGALQTSECVEGIRISGTADLPFSLSSRGVTFTLASWSAARIGSNASETKRPRCVRNR